MLFTAFKELYDGLSCSDIKIYKPLCLNYTKNIMTTVLLAMALVGAFFVLMATQIILKKDGKFKGTT